MPDTIEQDGTSYNLANSNVNSVANNPLDTTDSDRIYGRLISSGNIRGNQNITGTLTIVSDQTNNPTISLSGSDQSILVGSPATPVISISGNDERILVADTTANINRIIIGKLPDGTFGMVISKTGVDVLSVFG